MTQDESSADNDGSRSSSQNKDARALVIARRRECGIGLCGSCEAIARWLFREHGIVASTSWIADVLRRDERWVQPSNRARSSAGMEPL